MEAKLVIVSPADQTGEYTLQLPAVVGRGRDATLKLLHPQVSRRHCEIRESEEGLLVRDLGSLNGTYIGENRVENETRLRSGELLTVGSVTFRAVYEEQGGWLPEGVENLVGGTAAGAMAAGAFSSETLEMEAVGTANPDDDFQSLGIDQASSDEPPMDWLQESPAAATDTFRSTSEETVPWDAVRTDNSQEEPLEMSLDDLGSADLEAAPAVPAEAELAPLELADDDQGELPLEPVAFDQPDDEPLVLEMAEDDGQELSPEDDLSMSAEPTAAEPAVGLDFPEPIEDFAAENNKAEASAEPSSTGDQVDWSFLDADTAETPAEPKTEAGSTDDDEDLDNFFKSLQ